MDSNGLNVLKMLIRGRLGRRTFYGLAGLQRLRGGPRIALIDEFEISRCGIEFLGIEFLSIEMRVYGSLCGHCTIRANVG